jgi:arrestin-related trafficking adapter 4/5/7
MSRGPSRPGTPNRGMSNNSPHGATNPEVHLDGDDAVPVRPELGNWADSELLLSLGALAGANNSSHPTSGSNSPHQTPPESRNHSRPGSRLGIRGRTSQSNSRGNSRASSPDRQTLHAGHNSNGSSTPATSVAGDHGPEVVRPIPERRQSSGLPGLFHLPSMTGMHIKPFTAIGGRQLHRGMNGTSGTQSMDHSPTHSPLHSPSLQAAHLSTSLPRAGFSLGSHQAFTALAEQAHARDRIDPISQVPSYDIASQGFLGGGVVPIDAGPPTYDDSERMLQRTRSETDVNQLDHIAAHQLSLAAAAMDLRQSAVHLDSDGPGADGTPASLPATLPVGG